MEIQTFHKKRTQNRNEEVDRYVKVYQKLSYKLDKVAENVLYHCNQKFINNIKIYLNESYNNYKYNDSQDALPIGAMLLGASMSDHDMLFRYLSREIKRNKAHLVSLNSINCKKKRVLEIMYKELLKSADDISKSWKGSMNIVLDQLFQKKPNKLKQIVLVIEDVENFAEEELVRVLEVLSAQKNVCFVVLLGICTTMESGVIRRLPARILSKIQLSCFNNSSPIDLFNEFMRELIRKRFLIMFDWRTYNVLRNQYLHFDYSLQALLDYLKVCVHHHIYHNPHFVDIMEQPSSILIEHYTQYWHLFLLVSDWLAEITNQMATNHIQVNRSIFHNFFSNHLKHGISKSNEVKCLMNALRSVNEPMKTEEIIKKSNWIISNNQIKENDDPLCVMFVEEIENQISTNEIASFPDWFLKWTNEQIPHYSQLDIDLSDLFFTYTPEIMDKINPSPLATVRKGLEKRDEKSSSSSFEVDFCSLYRIVDEQTRNSMNKYDLLQCFYSKVSNEENDEAVPPQCVQKRFLIGLAELELMGLVGCTKSKPDVVNRLYWHGIL